ncbi:hypothetical protein [Endozoicomonas sp. SESOKO1]|uniref:hypothetical protein n=1 Tax=Endozoicomonas sp. SESOKO1 TaxID=2828742 RepID=UPI002147C0B8|nr:hypothetical protein [Endozoicomonas sp. SESOKO1]
MDNGKLFEDAFWKNKQLQSRKITSADVLAAYGKDITSLRGGFFLQKLCLQNILHDNRKVTPEQVIREFNRVPDRRNKYQLATGRFKAECCLRGLALNGQRVTPDKVVKDYQAANALLEIARFKEQCCLRGLRLHGQQVTPDEVYKDYQALGATLELARFREWCHLRLLPLHGRLVTPDAVVKGFPDSPEGKLGMARYKAECCLKNLALNGREVTPDAVVMDYRAVNATQELARFKAECCLGGLLLDGQPVTPDTVVRDFPDSADGRLGMARFKAECCLRGLPLHGQLLSPDAVARDFPDSSEGKLGLAHFTEQCFLRGLRLNGQQVTSDGVVRGFPDSPEGKLGVARFKEQCCEMGYLLNGQQVTPDAVVKDFKAARATLDLARFKEQCCLRRLPLNGRQVTPDAVIKDFPNNPEGRLGVARFKAECCLRGLLLNDQQVTPAGVVREYQAVRATLELARFKAECCLGGLLLNGQPVMPGKVVRDFPDSPDGKLGVARFKAACCLRGLLLNGQKVTPDAVVSHYQAAKAILELARFKAECCLKGLLLNGQLVTPEEVVKDFPDSPKGKLGCARFKEQFCLRGLLLNGQEVTPDAVVRDFPDTPDGKLGIVRFKAECCLRGVALNGQQVLPEAVVEDYERGGWLLERAIFYSQLALNAKELNNAYLDNQRVLAAFNEVPGDHSSRQARYLIQSLKQSREDDETNESRDIIQKAWQILGNVSVTDDERHRLQCLLMFMAMQYELSIDHQTVSAGQVLQAIKTLRRSFQNSRIHFFFLAHCHINRQPVDGREIRKNQVLECLQSFPEGMKLRHALSCWFEQCSSEARTGVNVRVDVLVNALIKRQSTFVTGQDSDGNRSANHEKNAGHGHGYQLPDVIPEIESSGRSAKSAGISVDSPASATRTLQQWSKAGNPGFPEPQAPRLNSLTLKTLEIIQEVNASYSSPPILITGSYARFLQNLCFFFNDIDIICTTEASARTLFQKLQTLNTDRDSEIPQSVVIWPISGCQEIKLPYVYNIQVKDGDLGTRAMGVQASVDARVTDEAARLAVHVPGVERPVRCLSFAEETRLLNDTLEYLVDNLEPLTEKLQKGAVFDLPRTILFNNPQNAGERIYGLLMRLLLTLNKARQFIALYSEGKTGKADCWAEQVKEEQRLYALTENLQMKLAGHVCRDDFEHRVNDWLSTTRHVSDYEIKRKKFIKALLAMMHPE